jgi:hypothetical protein
VGGDPGEIHWGPARPTGVGDPQPLLGCVNHGGRAVEADRPISEPPNQAARPRSCSDRARALSCAFLFLVAVHMERRSQRCHQGHGAPPGSLALTGRRPLAGDHPRSPAISCDRLGAQR